MKLSNLHEDGSWQAVSGHPGKLGDKSKIKIRGGKGKNRLSFMTHPEQRNKWFNEDNDITEVGSKQYSDDTIEHVRQGGTGSVGEVRKPSNSDIDEVGTTKYAQNTVNLSRKYIGPPKRIGKIKLESISQNLPPDDPETLGKMFNAMDGSDFIDYLRQRTKENPSTRFIIVADWVNSHKARAAKGILDQYASKLHIDAFTIRATRQQYLEDVNAFQSGVKWEEKEY
jgi:hypothetical protein